MQACQEVMHKITCQAGTSCEGPSIFARLNLRQTRAPGGATDARDCRQAAAGCTATDRQHLWGNALQRLSSPRIARPLAPGSAGLAPRLGESGDASRPAAADFRGSPPAHPRSAGFLRHDGTFLKARGQPSGPPGFPPRHPRMALKAEMPFQPLWRVKETGSQLTVRNQIRALQQFNQMPDRVYGRVDV